jgi:hypothetical protein
MAALLVSFPVFGSRLKSALSAPAPPSLVKENVPRLSVLKEVAKVVDQTLVSTSTVVASKTSSSFLVLALDGVSLV